MFNRFDELLHDARDQISTISVNAEVAKLLVQKSAPIADTVAALQKILVECQKCIEKLEQIRQEHESQVKHL